MNWLKWPALHNKGRKDAQFIETICDCSICQHLLEPTLTWSTDNLSLTDLVLTNEVYKYQILSYHPLLNKSKH